MKDSSYRILAIKTGIFSVFGLCVLPLLALIVQYIDSVIGFSNGNGYYTDSSRYIFESPLIYLLIFFSLNVVISIGFLIFKKTKKRDV